MNYDMDIAKRFLHFRKEYVGNMREMADLCGVSPKTISYAERGMAKINTDILQTLVRRKNLNVNWLLTGKGGPVAGNSERKAEALDIKGSVDLLEKRLLRMEAIIETLLKKVGVKG